VHDQAINVYKVCHWEAKWGDNKRNYDFEKNKHNRENKVEQVNRDAPPALLISVHVGEFKVNWLKHKGLKDLKK
jgi:hypothetical protein